MARNAAPWTNLECEGAQVAFREHWGGFIEIVCGESRVMLCHCGLERLTKLPPESALALLVKLLRIARTEQRNRAQAERLFAILEGSVQPHGS
jgi:hypothetical protein